MSEERRLLHSIDSPADLRRLSREQVEQVADEIRAEILDRVS
ncbi:MAG: 1-deoxy-D-xylulose-5-phosphate synthase N-terminal domain-containing protein, partial [Myxococcota bacterium]